MRRRTTSSLLLEIAFKIVIFCLIVKLFAYLGVFVAAFYVLTARAIR